MNYIFLFLLISNIPETFVYRPFLLFEVIYYLNELTFQKVIYLLIFFCGFLINKHWTMHSSRIRKMATFASALLISQAFCTTNKEEYPFI